MFRVLILWAVSFPLVLLGFLNKLCQIVCDYYVELKFRSRKSLDDVLSILSCPMLLAILIHVFCETFFPSLVKYLA